MAANDDSPFLKTQTTISSGNAPSDPPFSSPSSAMPDSIPLNLDPREPAPTSSPRSTSRPPTRSFTPHSSRPTSPHRTPGLLHLPGSTRSPSSLDPASHPPSPISPSSHFSSQQGREEGENSSIFERDVETVDTAPLSLASSTSSAPLATTVTSPPSPTASPLGASKLSQQLHPSPSHHPVARASVTDRIFPTVLDDAVEALASSSQGGGDVFVVSALSQTPSRDPSPSRILRREPRDASPGGPSEERNRRESGVSLGGQADKLLHSSEDLLSSTRSSPEPEGGLSPHSGLLSMESRLSLSPSHSPRHGNSPLHSPIHSPRLPPLGPQAGQGLSMPHSPSSNPSSTSSFSHPSNSPHHHRLNFISPQDLITSPPLSTQSLSSITSGASLLPSIGSPDSGQSATQHDAWSQSTSPALFKRGLGGEGLQRAGSSAEWERGGLGKGLEERLEQLVVEEKEKEGAASS